MYKFLTSFIIILCLASCQTMSSGLFSDEESDNTSETEEIHRSLVSTKLYQVLSTDSIASIARKHGTTPEEIISLNHLKKPYYIKPGELIKVPNIYDEGGYKVKPKSTPERRAVIIAPKKKEDGK